MPAPSSPSSPQGRPRPVRVAVVNDYAVVVAGVAQMLAGQDGALEVVEVAIGSPAGPAADIVLCDTFAQPPGTTLDRLRHRDLAAARWIVFSWCTEPEKVRASFEAGAAGFVAKSVSAAELVEAIVRVHRGERVVLAPSPVGGTAPPDWWLGGALGLSVRETEVLALICRGLSNVEIARQMFLGLNTIKTYIRTAYRKIGAESRAQAVIWGYEHGLEPPRHLGAEPRGGR